MRPNHFDGGGFRGGGSRIPRSSGFDAERHSRPQRHDFPRNPRVESANQHIFGNTVALEKEHGFETLLCPVTTAVILAPDRALVGVAPSRDYLPTDETSASAFLNDAIAVITAELSPSATLDLVNVRFANLEKHLFVSVNIRECRGRPQSDCITLTESLRHDYKFSGVGVFGVPLDVYFRSEENLFLFRDVNPLIPGNFFAELLKRQLQRTESLRYSSLDCDDFRCVRCEWYPRRRRLAENSIAQFHFLRKTGTASLLYSKVKSKRPPVLEINGGKCEVQMDGGSHVAARASGGGFESSFVNSIERNEGTETKRDSSHLIGKSHVHEVVEEKLERVGGSSDDRRECQRVRAHDVDSAHSAPCQLPAAAAASRTRECVRLHPAPERSQRSDARRRSDPLPSYSHRSDGAEHRVADRQRDERGIEDRRSVRFREDPCEVRSAQDEERLQYHVKELRCASAGIGRVEDGGVGERFRSAVRDRVADDRVADGRVADDRFERRDRVYGGVRDERVEGRDLDVRRVHCDERRDPGKVQREISYEQSARRSYSTEDSRVAYEPDFSERMRQESGARHYAKYDLDASGRSRESERRMAAASRSPVLQRREHLRAQSSYAVERSAERAPREEYSRRRVVDGRGHEVESEREIVRRFSDDRSRVQSGAHIRGDGYSVRYAASECAAMRSPAPARMERECASVRSASAGSFHRPQTMQSVISGTHSLASMQLTPRTPPKPEVGQRGGYTAKEKLYLIWRDFRGKRLTDENKKKLDTVTLMQAIETLPLFEHWLDICYQGFGLRYMWHFVFHEVADVLHTRLFSADNLESYGIGNAVHRGAILKRVKGVIELEKWIEKVRVQTGDERFDDDVVNKLLRRACFSTAPVCSQLLECSTEKLMTEKAYHWGVSADMVQLMRLVFRKKLLSTDALQSDSKEMGALELAEASEVSEEVALKGMTVVRARHSHSASQSTTERRTTGPTVTPLEDRSRSLSMKDEREEVLSEYPYTVAREIKQCEMRAPEMRRRVMRDAVPPLPPPVEVRFHSGAAAHYRRVAVSVPSHEIPAAVHYGAIAPRIIEVPVHVAADCPCGQCADAMSHAHYGDARHGHFVGRVEHGHSQQPAVAAPVRMSDGYLLRESLSDRRM